ncbi:hypothetical protein BOTCAL_0144g00060 [Botryotinia calthae]|uniref:Uncharacterized protein n=1 Tax=Botryotinia calthae TaxID=38488 RepID=A0A4Y8D2Z1_9HELO|nr:hypothetical protein BOTCAL_0144g00060 [Botryotinia calthae]
MHFPALLADERLTQLQRSTATAQYSGSSEATHNSPIQISCIVLIILGIVAKAAFAVESLDWLDYGNLVFSTTTDYICSSLNSGLGSLDINMALVPTEGNMRYSYDYGYGLVLVPG